MISQDPSIWVAALTTICIYSVLIKENPAFKWAEHSLIGLAAGIYTVYGIENIQKMVIKPIAGGESGALFNLIPLAGGLLLYTRFSKRHSYYSRWMLGMLIAAGIGAGMVSSAQTRILNAVAETIPTFADPMATFNEIVMLIAVVATIIFFTFSREHKGAIGYASMIGRFLIMVGLGANFGNAFSSRMGYVIGRLNFLLLEWLKIR
jgi:hypothetical protein